MVLAWWPLAVAGALLLGCTVGRQAAPTPTPDPLAAVRQWGAAVRSYRYERTTLARQPNGDAEIVRESGAVLLPDRQQISVRGSAARDEASQEIIIVGERAWVRPAAIGARWEPVRAERLVADPLTLALGTLAAAGPPRDGGQRQEEDGRRCQGVTYAFDPAAVPAWPAPPVGGALTAEATLWREANGALCGQTVRLLRDGQPDAEYTVVLYAINAPLTIEPPADS